MKRILTLTVAALAVAFSPVTPAAAKVGVSVRAPSIIRTAPSIPKVKPYVAPKPKTTTPKTSPVTPLLLLPLLAPEPVEDCDWEDWWNNEEECE